MSSTLSRRDLLQAGGLGVFALSAAARRAIAQAPAPVVPAFSTSARATVSLVQGDSRRKNVFDSLMAIDHQIAPQLKQKKYVVIKPNFVSTKNQLAASNADAIRGILDYVSERFHGPVIIAESSAGNTNEGFDAFGYHALVSEYRKHKLTLVDLNTEGRYEILPVLDFDLHPTPVRLAARLLDPEAFVFSSAMLKTHNTVVATLSVKNMCLGAPLHQSPTETVKWNDKRKYHVGLRQTHYNMLLTAQRLQPFWGAAVIDGYDGMEGDGPGNGTLVPSRIALASTDFVAADRVGVEAMGIKAENIGYLLYCWQAGVGQYDLNKIDVIGAQLAAVRRTYRQHPDIDKELQWMGPLNKLPERVG